ATRAFIRTTHDRYAQYGGDAFGSAVRFVFNDEPHVNASKNAFPYSPFVEKEFHRDHGYPLEENLDALLFWEERSPEVRYDYYRTLNRLYNENFNRPLHDWCAQHSLEFTGHYMEHEWPRPISQPDTMASLRWMQAPGNDLLGFQFVTDGPEENGIYFLNMKELRSVANQLDRANVMVESCGGAGYDAAFDVFKPTEDYLLAFGVNIMDPHLSHYSLVGARKYDFAQTLSDHSSWWPYYRSHADHVGRTIAAMEGTTEENRTLVLHPTATGWLHYQPAGFPWDQGPNPGVLERLRQSQIDLLLALYASQIDYDLGDEPIMEELASVDDGRLRVGAGIYETIVIPRGMETWSAVTARLVAEFLAGGGLVLQLGDDLSRTDGRPSDEPRRLRAANPERWIVCESEADVAARVRERSTPWLSAPDGGALSDRLVWRRSVAGDGSVVWFFANPWREPLEADLLVDAPAGLVELDTRDGRAAPVDTSSGRRSLVHLRLAPRGHRLLLAPAGEVPDLASAPAGGDRSGGGQSGYGQPGDASGTGPAELPLELVSVAPVEENRLIVDFCDLEANGRSLTDVNTVVADRTAWRWQGYVASPWLMAGGIKPFRSSAFRAAVDRESTFRLTYRFVVADDAGVETMRSVSLAVERPEHYTVSVNGNRIDPGAFTRWFDVAMGRAPVGGFLVRGENTVVVESIPWNTMCEAAPVYLLGRFGLEPITRGFAIRDPRELELGDWTAAGMPFYPAGVDYRFRLGAGGEVGDGAAVDHSVRRVRISLGEWAGALVVVFGGGRRLGEIVHPPYELDVDFPDGGDEIELRVIGNMRNMMGPFFSDGVPVSPRWAAGPEHMPPGREYRSQPSGLFEMPRVWAV
ncbi:MAG: hypothetical protein ACOCVW_02865, partial [bacterium]